MAVRKIKGSWWVDFQIRHERHRYRSPENTREGALAFEAVLRQKIARGETIAQRPSSESDPFFTVFVTEWIETQVRTQNKPSEVRAKLCVLKNHLLPFFGKVRIKRIDARLVEEYKMQKIRSGLTAKTVNNHLFILQRCLNVAMEWGRIERVPKIPKLKCVSQRLDFLTPIESHRLVQCCDEPMWRDMLLMALRTGIRLGELCGLQWRDIDLQRKILTVQHSLVRGVLGTPKNHKSRHIPLTDDLCRTLYERRHEQGFVFRRPNGEPIVDWVAECGIRRACKKAGIRSVGWHTLRHTFASHLVTEGVPINAVQELLGHSSIVMTMRYAHLAPSALRSAVDVLERAETREVGKECQPGVNLENILAGIVP